MTSTAFFSANIIRILDNLDVISGRYLTMQQEIVTLLWWKFNYFYKFLKTLIIILLDRNTCNMHLMLLGFAKHSIYQTLSKTTSN